MATPIENYLSKIQTAVYGKDVRQSIYNAINRCYLDATVGITPDITVVSTSTGSVVTITVGAVKRQFTITNGQATNEQVETYVQEWLDAHPEATTTVEDGSITEDKLEPTLAEQIKNGGNSKQGFLILRSILDHIAYTADVSGLLEDYDAIALEGSYKVLFKGNEFTYDNDTKYLEAGSSYTTTITPNDGMKIYKCVVTMGTEDISATAYKNGVVTIESIEGNVVIEITCIDANLVFLKNITLGEETYIDTEYVPQSYTESYVLGIGISDDITEANTNPFAGVDRLPASTIAVEEYLHLRFAVRWTDSNPTGIISSYGAYKNGDGSITMHTGNYETNNGLTRDNMKLRPFYFKFTSKGQCLLKADENLTTDLTTTPFNSVSTTANITTTAALPLDSIYLGKIHSAGSRTTNSFSGVTFYRFKVFDDDGNLVVDMYPAILSGIIGMYDSVTAKLYPVTGSNYSYEEVA